MKKKFSRIIKAFRIARNVRANLEEDAKFDVTTSACCKHSEQKAVVIAKDSFIFCGFQEARAIFRPLRVKSFIQEGQLVKSGNILFEVCGDVTEILRKERTALNYIQILSGIATNTSKLIRTYGEKIAALRKVHPGMEICEKRAVAIGGGLTHRLNLSDGYLIKDNHIKSVQNELKISRLKAIRIAVDRVLEHRQKHNKKLFVEVEVFSLKEALLAAQKDVDAILIDNQKPETVRKIVKGIKKVNKKIIIEASGGINKKNIGRYLATGVDFVSMSELTLNSKPVDVSLEIK